MEKQFLMGNDGVLVRSITDKNERTIISPRLHKSLIRRAMVDAFEFFSTFFGEVNSSKDFDKLVAEYEHELSHAHSLHLFAPGGIREKDHLNLWCLSRVFAPEVYIESGVFIGSSLHAFIKSPSLKKVIAIDPDLSNLKINKSDIPEAIFISNKDFSELELSDIASKTLVYFDDHINTAARIIQAAEKGITYLLFDDSTGFEGICQRLYPAIPTIPMIMNAEILKPGDQLSWTFKHSSSENKLKRLVKQIIGLENNQKTIRVSLCLTDELIAECRQAQRLVKKWSKIPDLGQYIPQSSPEKLGDTSKYLIELNKGSL